MSKTVNSISSNKNQFFFEASLPPLIYFKSHSLPSDLHLFYDYYLNMPETVCIESGVTELDNWFQSQREMVW